MSLGSSLDAKEQVRQAIDIVDLIGGYLSLRRQGANYVGHCPWHDDQKPSLTVNPDRQNWKCWVCDIGGDLFSFVQRREGLEFRETLQLLADRAGIELKTGPRVQPGGPNDRRTLLKAMAWAEQLYHDYLLNSPEAERVRLYIHERKISPESTRRFRIGYAPADRNWIQKRAKDTEFSPQVLQAVDLVKRYDTGVAQDRFAGRLIFPIRDAQSRPIAIGGRVLPWDDHPAKYINSGETKLFHKSDHLYALDKAREALDAARRAKEPRMLVVVEGYTDVIAAHQAGVTNVVAALGTALNERHIRNMRRYADRVCLILDGDEAGQITANRVLNLFVTEDVDLRIVTLPGGLDPCDFLVQQGADRFRQELEQADDALEFRIKRALEGIDPKTQTHLANQALEEILETLAQAPRIQSDTRKRLREQQTLTRLARMFHVSEGDLRSRIAELRSRSSSRSGPSQLDKPKIRYRLSDLTPSEAELFELLLRAPQAWERVEARVAIEDLPTMVGKALLAAFLRLAEQGRAPDYSQVLTELEDPDLKNVLVELDRIAGEKIVHAQMDPDERLTDWFEQRRRGHAEQQLQETAQEIEGHSYSSEQEERDLVARVFSLAQKRQGLSDPTDG